jgi:hypothetical protein
VDARVHGYCSQGAHSLLSVARAIHNRVSTTAASVAHEQEAKGIILIEQDFFHLNSFFITVTVS